MRTIEETFLRSKPECWHTPVVLAHKALRETAITKHLLGTFVDDTTCFSLLNVLAKTGTFGLRCPKLAVHNISRV